MIQIVTHIKRQVPSESGFSEMVALSELGFYTDGQ